MEQSRPVIPLRPLTFGELLDAAVLLLRSHAKLFLLAALVLALCEQAILHPLRTYAGVNGSTDLFYSEQAGLGWLAFCTGLATEGAVLVLLGGLTGAAAGPALLGTPVTARELLRGWLRRAPALLALAVFVAIILLVSALVFVPWIYFFGAVGLAAPALVIDRIWAGAALGRSFGLASTGLRGVSIRIGSYTSWAAIRIALGYGGIALAARLLPSDPAVALVATTVLWIAVNTIVYAALACLDAVLYLETRMRVEGLDLTVGRSRRHGTRIDLARSALLGAGRR